MQLEWHQLDFRYQDLRVFDRSFEQRLLASLCTKGQQHPVWVVPSQDTPRRFVLIDGYKRTRCLRRLKNDVVKAVTFTVDEDELLCLSLLKGTRKINAFEEAWLLRTLGLRFGWTQSRMAQRFLKSKSWVSRRLALIEDLSPEVQKAIRLGYLCPHGAMRFLAPLARANFDDCDRLVAGLKKTVISSRQLEIVTRAYRAAGPQERHRICENPWLFIKSEQAHTEDKKELDDVNQEEGLNQAVLLLATHLQGIHRHIEPYGEKGVPIPPAITEAWSSIRHHIEAIERSFYGA